MFSHVKDQKPGRELGETGRVIFDVLEGDGWSFLADSWRPRSGSQMMSGQ